MADNQYHTLGLMLLGCLATFQSLLVDAGSEFGVEVNLVTSSQVEGEGVTEEVLLADGAQTDHGDDLGEVIERSVLKNMVSVEKNKDLKDKRDKIKGVDGDDDSVDDSKRERKRKHALAGSKAEKLVMAIPTEPPKKKKKRKKADEFDDLFGGLI